MKVKCEYCGAEFEALEDVPVATCPYCGTTIRVETGERFTEHYAFAVNYDYNDAFRKLISLVAREVGSPKDLKTSASPMGGRLHYVPLYIYRIELYAYWGDRRVSEQVRDEVALAAPKVPVPIPAGYRFPVRGRVYFDPAAFKKGVYYTPTVKPENLLDAVEQPHRAAVIAEAELELGRGYLETAEEVRVESKSRCVGLAHYPFWELKYSYRGSEYTGYVDASDGTVIYAEYPKALERRSAVVLSATLLSAAAVGVALPLVYRYFPLTYTLAGSLAAALAPALRALTRSVGGKAVYRLSVTRIGRSAEVR